MYFVPTLAIGNSSYYNAATQPGPISIREPDAKDD
jgi:hypothetical protein